MKKVLIFTYLQRHLKKMIPIIKQFEKDDNIKLYVVLLTQEEKEIAESHEIRYKMLDEYTLKPRNHDFDLGWAMEPLIHAIDFIEPDLFIAIEVNYILRNAIRYCKQKGIPNLVVQHGTPNEYSLHAFAPFEGDCFAAWGQFTKDFLIQNYVQPNKIFLTGGVPFDRTLSLNPDRIKIGSKLSINPQKKWVIFTTQGVGAGNRPSDEEITLALTEITAESKKFPDVQLIFQVHPAQTIDQVKHVVDTVADHNAIVTKYHDTEELIAASEGVITFFSTTAIDAVLLQKPLLLINLVDNKDFFPFVKMGAAFGAYKKEEISQGFKHLVMLPQINLENAKSAAHYVNYKNDGKALERVMQLCYSKLGGK